MASEPAELANDAPHPMPVRGMPTTTTRGDDVKHPVDLYATRGIVALRAFGWQIDYRPDGWLPLSYRRGLRPDWKVLRLGRLGVVTLGPLR